MGWVVGELERERVKCEGAWVGRVGREDGMAMSAGRM